MSGSALAIKLGNWINRQLTKRGIAHHLYVTNWPQTLDGCAEAWIVGGDGTANYFLNKYKNISIPLALFKGGTGNDIFWKLYGNINREEQLHKALTSAAKPVDAASCNGAVYINSSGIGFDGEVLRSRKSIRIIGGHLGYLYVVLRKIFSFREPTFTIINQKTITGKFLLVAVNNSSRTGGGFLVTPNASLTDGLLDVMLCAPLSIFSRLRYLPVIEKGNHLKYPFIKYTQEKEITIEAEKTLYAHLDGELISGNKFHFKSLPGFVRIKY